MGLVGVVRSNLDARFGVFIAPWIIVFGFSDSARAGQLAGQGVGVIEGRVVDESQAVLPGVTVTANSPALQGQRVTTSIEDGTYHIVNLPPGEYRVTYELAGFGTVVREGLMVNVGFTTRVDPVLKPGAVTENVTVTGQSPVIDTAHTEIQSNITAAKLASVPTTNTIYEILGLTPGIRMDNSPDVGGSRLALQIGYRNYGLPNNNAQVLDGVNTNTGDGSGGGATFTDVLSWEEVQVAAAAQDASIQLPGSSMFQIIKQGGNDFHSLLQYGGEWPTLEANNITPALIAQGITNGNPLDSFTDLFGDLGGRIVRDRIWFYGALREQKETNDVLGYVGTHQLENTNQTMKVSYSPAKGMKFIGVMYRNLKDEPDRQASSYMPFPSTLDYSLPNYMQKGEFQWIPSSRVLVNAAVYGFHWQSFFLPQPSADVAGGAPATYNLTTLNYTGPDRYNESRANFQRLGTDATVTLFPEHPFFGGQHSIKLGFHGYPYEEGHNLPVPNLAGNYELIYTNNAAGVPQPFELQTYWWPTSQSNGNEYAAFAEDSVTLKRVTLNLGLRYDRYRSWLPAQSSPATEFGPAVFQPAVEATELHSWNPIDPRLGIAWDIRGNGRTVVKAFFGRFGFTPGYSYANSFNANTKVTTTYKWTDPTHCACYAPGSVNLATSNNPAFVSITGGKASAVENTNLQEPWTTEEALSFEQELMPGMGLRLGWVRTSQSGLYAGYDPARPYSAYTIPITEQIPTTAGLTGPADPNGDITIWTYPAALSGAAYSLSELVNRASGRPNDVYNGIEGTLIKRQKNGQPWDAAVTFSLTNTNAYVAAANAVPQSPNQDYFAIQNTWDYELRINGSYKLKHDVLLAVVWRYSRGDPGQITYTFRSIPQLSTVTIPLDNPGDVHAPSLQYTNFKVSKKFAIGGSRRLSFDLDIFNVFNINTPQGAGYGSGSAVSFVAGPTYGFPNAIVPPRIMRATFGFSF